MQKHSGKESLFIIPDSVVLNNHEDSITILDQTQLPTKEVYLTLNTEDDIINAIVKLKLRGAPSLGVAAAFGLYVCFSRTASGISSKSRLKETFYGIAARLRASRPTAVNLAWALERMCRVFDRMIVSKDYISADDFEEMKRTLRAEAVTIKDEDILMCRKIGDNGVKLISKGNRILTHCNAGHLAVSRYGTALSPIYKAQDSGLMPEVYVDETRPLLQGARLTAYELMKYGVKTTLVCDNMAASLMSRGLVDMVMVGCDRIAANGDVANKIGTCNVAIIAKYYDVPFYVLGPSSTFDPNTATGKDIIIEQRAASEVTKMHYKHRMAPEGIDVYNPAFDITPAALVTAYITENGIFKG